MKLILTPNVQKVLSKKLANLNDIIFKENIDLIEKQQSIEKERARFRIRILGGGCFGYQYEFTIDSTINQNDVILFNEGLQFETVIDKFSLPLLLGSIIDYEFAISGERFIVQNPNSQSHCGCGNSFTT